jgi:hypothetical protein
MLPNCMVGFKRGYKYFRGELVDGKIIKSKHFKHLSDIPKWDKYVSIKFYIRKSKSKINLDELFKELEIDGSLNLLVDKIPVTPKVKKPRRGKVDKEPEAKVYKVEKTPKVDKATLSVPISADLTPKQWERQWFKVKNQLCLGCTKTCKQSARLVIVACPKYNKKD